MKDLEYILDNEQWDKAIKVIIKDRSLVTTIDPEYLAYKRYQYQLAENGKIELVKPYGKNSDLQKFIDLCKEEGVFCTSIPQAAALQQLDDIEFHLQNGSDIDEQNFQGVTGLLISAALNDFELVKYFINKGANVSYFEQEDLEAIDLTTSKEIIALLHSKGGKTEQERNTEYNEYCDAREYLNEVREINLAFLKSAENGDFEQLVISFEKSKLKIITINFASFNGWTALHYAVKNNDKRTIDFLIKNGIDVDKKNINGLTAKDLSKKLGRENLFRV